MSRYMVNLPAAQMPQNAMLNFEPVSNALIGIQRQQNQNRQYAMAD